MNSAEAVRQSLLPLKPARFINARRLSPTLGITLFCCLDLSLKPPTIASNLDRAYDYQPLYSLSAPCIISTLESRSGLHSARRPPWETWNWIVRLYCAGRTDGGCRFGLRGGPPQQSMPMIVSSSPIRNHLAPPILWRSHMGTNKLLDL